MTKNESIVAAATALVQLWDRMREMGMPPHTDFWHQSIDDHHKALKAAVARPDEPEGELSAGCPIHGVCPACAAVNLFAPHTRIFKVTAQAASAAEPSILTWVCTKHGNLPLYECEQCETGSG